MLAIDPGSNNMGWAYYSQGELFGSGVISADEESDQDKRITLIHDRLQLMALKHSPDVVVIEKMFRFNPPLIWSVAAAILAVRAPIVIEMPVKLWQAQLDSTYVKSDERDAIEIGKTLVYLARANV